MTINAEHIATLKLCIPNIEAIVATGNIQSVLDAIDDIILDNILGNNGEPDNVGIALQKKL